MKHFPPAGLSHRFSLQFQNFQNQVFGDSTKLGLSSWSSIHGHILFFTMRIFVLSFFLHTKNVGETAGSGLGLALTLAVGSLLELVMFGCVMVF